MTPPRASFTRRVTAVLDGDYGDEGWLARLTALVVLGLVEVTPLLVVIVATVLGGVITGFITSLFK